MRMGVAAHATCNAKLAGAKSEGLLLTFVKLLANRKVLQVINTCRFKL